LATSVEFFILSSTFSVSLSEFQFANLCVCPPRSYFSSARNGYLKAPFAAATPEAAPKGAAKPAEAPQQQPLLLGHPSLGFPGLMDMSSTQALLSMVRSANLEQYLKVKQGPLDLSAAAPQPPPAKKNRSELKSVSPKPPPRSASSGSASSAPGHGCPSLCTERPCEGQAVAHWTVDDVCTFVASIDICAEYAQVGPEFSLFLLTRL
jgi:hypothetical protein